MSDTTANRPEAAAVLSLVELVRTAQPMGDLHQFVIADLSVEDENEYYSILEQA